MRILPVLLPVLLAAAGCSHRPAILRQALPHVVGIRDPAFHQAIGSLVSRGMVDGNRITTLNNGREIFPAMLSAIRGARHSVNFETYVFEKGEVPEAFVAAFAEKARQGVPVRVILDAHGSSKARRYHDELKAAGVQVEEYHSFFQTGPQRYTYRTHRKLLIIDGKLAFTGGVGIAKEWDGDARNPEEWRDLHYRVEGPVVAQLQAAFNDNWQEVQGEILQGPAYFPALPKIGSYRASFFPSTPTKKKSSPVELMYHLAIASARHSLLIENAYFIPNEALVQAFCEAAQRGVKVQIIMPGEHIDQKAVRRASRKRWPKLLEAGVELYEYEPTMIHTKLLIADGEFTSVGSANFDPRSLRINDEANLNVLSRSFAAEQTWIFQRDLQKSKPVEQEHNGVKSLPEKPVQAAQAPVEGQL